MEDLDEKEATEPAINDLNVESSLKLIGGVTILAGLIAAIVMLVQAGKYGVSDDLQTSLQIQALIYFVSGLVGGTAMIGFSKVITLLISINESLKKNW